MMHTRQMHHYVRVRPGAAKVMQLRPPAYVRGAKERRAQLLSRVRGAAAIAIEGTESINR